MLLMMIGLLMVSCATLTPEEKAARQAERSKSVKESVSSMRYRINVSSMTPLRGQNRPIPGFWLKVDSTSVSCDLPYIGRDDIPHLKTPAEIRMDSRINLRFNVEDYLVEIDPEEESAVITFKTFDGSIYFRFNIEVEDDGDVRMRVTPEGRDYIDYEGSITSLK